MVKRQRLLDALRACAEANECTGPDREERIRDAGERAHNLIALDQIARDRACDNQTCQQDMVGEIADDVLAYMASLKATPPVYNVANDMLVKSEQCAIAVYFDWGSALLDLQDTIECGEDASYSWEEWTYKQGDGTHYPPLELAMHASRLVEQYPPDHPWWHPFIRGGCVDIPDAMLQELRAVYAITLNQAIAQFLSEGH